MIEIPDPNSNYPCLSDKPCGAGTNRMFKNARVAYSTNDEITNSPDNLDLAMMSGGYYECLTGCTESIRNKAQMNQLLNNVSPSFEGMVLKFSPGTYHYKCSRNNNFTNRSQKGMLTVTASS